jgi:hypothetical protein
MLPTGNESVVMIRTWEDTISLLFLGTLVKHTELRLLLYKTLVALSTLTMAFPLLSTYAKRSVAATDWLTQIVSPCA